MRYYFICLFHIVIISFFLGCGYKAPPTWEEKKKDINASDLRIFDANSTIKLEIGVR